MYSCRNVTTYSTVFFCCRRLLNFDRRVPPCRRFFGFCYCTRTTGRSGVPAVADCSDHSSAPIFVHTCVRPTRSLWRQWDRTGVGSRVECSSDTQVSGAFKDPCASFEKPRSDPCVMFVKNAYRKTRILCAKFCFFFFFNQTL